MSERWPFEVMCCFCGQKVEQKYPDPCTVVIGTTKEDEWQQFYCHATCFHDRLVEKARDEIRYF
jgi:hypothetical protein